MLPPANSRIGALIRGQYRPDDVATLRRAIADMGALAFPRLESGLFSASPDGGGTSESGYQNVWVRDNVYVAYAHLEGGDVATAVGVARALLAFFRKYERRLLDVITGVSDPDDVSKRPHVRFDGRTLEEIPGQKWSHAQNDALGYFLWLTGGLARRGALRLSTPEAQTLLAFLRYLNAIQYWRDPDSGHWEEVRKVSASSIGTVLAGLRELSALLVEQRQDADLAVLRLEGGELLLDDLVARGAAALDAILPSECLQPAPRQTRRYDAALSFLVHPLRIVEGDMARRVLADIDAHLTGEIGIRRYPGDSYWAPDYDVKLSAVDRTRDFSDDIEMRDRLLERPGDEAQWCIFDALISAHHGVEFATTRDPGSRERQVDHLNRALRQITAEGAAVPNRCPELYYLKEGQLVPNPHTPLQWTQANLVVALEQMRRTSML